MGRRELLNDDGSERMTDTELVEHIRNARRGISMPAADVARLAHRAYDWISRLSHARGIAQANQHHHPESTP